MSHHTHVLALLRVGVSPKARMGLFILIKPWHLVPHQRGPVFVPRVRNRTAHFLLLRSRVDQSSKWTSNAERVPETFKRIRVLVCNWSKKSKLCDLKKVIMNYP